MTIVTHRNAFSDVSTELRGGKVDSFALRTELQVLPISPVQLFRNLYIDLSWYPLEGKGRHLQESCGD